MNINLVKEKINNNLNKEVEIKVYGMRNKINTYTGILKATYPNIFTINNGVNEKSFSYSDVITGEVKIKYLK